MLVACWLHERCERITQKTNLPKNGLSHAAHTSAGLEGAVGLLCEAWGTEPPTPVSMRAGSSMCMVELPPALEITDTPGVPGAGVRGQLRERYKIEAAVRETSF